MNDVLVSAVEDLGERAKDMLRSSHHLAQEVLASTAALGEFAAELAELAEQGFDNAEVGLLVARFSSLLLLVLLALLLARRFDAMPRGVSLAGGSAWRASRHCNARATCTQAHTRKM